MYNQWISKEMYEFWASGILYVAVDLIVSFAIGSVIAFGWEYVTKDHPKLAKLSGTVAVVSIFAIFIGLLTLL